MQKLLVNHPKSNTMLFGSRQRISQPTFNITINFTPAVASETLKLLGINFNSKMSWVSMYVTLLNTSWKVRLIKRLCSFLPRSVLN